LLLGFLDNIFGGSSNENWNNKGFAFIEQQNFIEALRCFDKAMKSNPRDGVSWNGKAVALQRLGRYEEAIKAFDYALDIDSNSWETWLNKSQCLADLSEYAFLESSENPMLMFRPPKPEGLAHTITRFSSNPSAGYQEALKAVNRSIQINPEYPISWQLKSRIHGCLKQYEEALQALDQVFMLYPDYPHKWVIKGTIARLFAVKFGRNDLFEVALSAFNLVSEDDELFWRGQYGKMQVLKGLGRDNDAEQVLVQLKKDLNYEVRIKLNELLENFYSEDNDVVSTVMRHNQ
jgi:tetratricopeptide (TPR) repeat protein